MFRLTAALCLVVLVVVAVESHVLDPNDEMQGAFQEWAEDHKRGIDLQKNAGERHIFHFNFYVHMHMRNSETRTQTDTCIYVCLCVYKY